MAEVEIFKLFALVMVRVSGLMVSAPLLGSRNFPIPAKIGLTALMAMLITPVLPPLTTPIPGDPLAFALAGVGELLIGIIMGFVMTLVFASVQIAGQIMDLQTGFGMMNVFNPALESQFPIFGFFLFIVAVLYLLITGGHREMLLALSASYEHVPAGGFAVRPELLLEVSTWGRQMFVDGLMLSAPVATAMMLAYATLGLLNRAMPQLNLFAVGFSITIAAGLFVTAITLGVCARMLDGMYGDMFRNVSTLVLNLG